MTAAHVSIALASLVSAWMVGFGAGKASAFIRAIKNVA